MTTERVGSTMSDRSDEVTTTRRRDGGDRSTDDLLEETERLLSTDDAAESPSTTSESALERVRTADSGSRWPSFGSKSDDADSRRSRLSPARYFSPTAFLVLAVAFATGLVVGGAAIPYFGRFLGVFTAAFLVGLTASKRRYLEVLLAGVSVGATASLWNHAAFALTGSGLPFAVGATTGVVGAGLGYYFGRDLRDGLVRDL
jgi:hypothetical protein